MIKNVGHMLTFDKIQKSRFLELFEWNQSKIGLKFGLLIIWDVTVTIGPFLKYNILAIDMENMSFDYFRTMWMLKGGV